MSASRGEPWLQLTEIVAIDGFMNSEDLEEFIQSFPIDRV